MKTIKKIAIASVMFILCSTPAFASEDERRGRGGRRQGPPPEAYAACEGKSAGDKAEFVSPRGDTVTGVCEAEGDAMVLHPDNPPPDRGKERE